MNRFLMSLLCILIVGSLVCIYGIGGQIGAYVWNLMVFIGAPVAVIVTLVQLVLLLVAICKKKKLGWKIGFIVISIIFALPITVLFGISPITYPANAEVSEGVSATMPIEGGTLFGGKEYKTHAMWPSECYAYDILKKPYEVGSNKLEDYGIFGCEVVAPVSGTVIAVENNEIDIMPNTEEFLSALGNYVVIRIDETGTYMILAHLKQNSISVSINEHINEGDFIGYVGNSGTTSEPHLHIQHQRNNPVGFKFPSCAEGLPIYFK